MDEIFLISPSPSIKLQELVSLPELFNYTQIQVHQSDKEAALPPKFQLVVLEALCLLSVLTFSLQ